MSEDALQNILPHRRLSLWIADDDAEVTLKLGEED